MSCDKRFVYLDYAASAPLRPEALEAEDGYRDLACAGANPNSLHTLGRQAARLLDQARSDVARALGGGFRPSDVVFTSGGTESNNLAIVGIAEGVRERDRSRNKVILSAIEHDSVLDLVHPLRDRGFEVALVSPSRQGVIEPSAVEAVLDRTCCLVSVMAANNETGVIQPLVDLARVAHAAGARFHTDAVQGFCRIPLDLGDVDAVSVAAHKVGGPVGIGALALRGRCPLRPLTFGGGQEQGRRPGTQDVRSALSFAAAVRACTRDLDATRELVSARADRLYGTLCAPDTGILPTTSATTKGKLPGMVSVMVAGLDSETLILKLDDAGFEVSAGSACSSGSLDPSHVLTAMGIPRDDAFGSLRISFDERVGERDLADFAECLVGVVGRSQRGDARS